MLFNIIITIFFCFLAALLFLKPLAGVVSTEQKICFVVTVVMIILIVFNIGA